MAGGQEISISKALWEGLEGVVHDVSRDEDRQIVVLAAYLDRLAEGYGLSDRHEDELVSRATQQALFLPFVGHYLADGEAVEPERIRNRLYTALDGVDAADCDLVPGLGKITRDSRLKIAQVYWNLSWDGADRPGLPLKPGPLVDGRDKDGQPTHYRTSIWADWVGEDLANHLRVRRTDLVKGGTVGTSGNALRAKGSLLAVLAATHIVRLRGLADSHLLEGAELRGSDEGRPPTSFGWPAPEQVVLNQVTLKSTPPWGGSFVTVGRPVDPGEGYQRRGFEDEIEGFWGDGRDRRVWLLGGTGLGKSCTAGRMAQDFIGNQGESRERLLVWVDSADVAATTAAYAEAFGQLRELGFPVRGRSEDSDETKARALLDALATTLWPWLVVLDDADPASLIQTGLVPSGRNPNGRVLVTTMQENNRMRSNGRVVVAELFTADEAEAFLRNEVHSRGSGGGALSSASEAETKALAGTVAYHPLALSIAVGTILAKAMTIREWIDDFRDAPVLDSAADEPDSVGYPRLIGAAWQVALNQASRGLPDGAVERAALVAAMQNPDGHPTWLWDGPLASWVAGKPTPHGAVGMPPSVRRLVDYRILDLRGGIWRGGKLAIHQLAARTIREHARRQQIEELAQILVDEWLLHVAEFAFDARAELRSNIAQLLSLATVLPEGPRRTVSALAEFSRERTGLADRQRRFAALEPHLEAGGVTGRVHRAEDLASLAAEQASVGLHVEAEGNYRRSAEDYEALSADPSADDLERADWLGALGRVYDGLGQPNAAQRSRERAVDVYKRLLEAELDLATRLECVLSLGNLYDKLGRSTDKHDVLNLNREALLAGAASLPAISEAETNTSVLLDRGFFTARFAGYLKQIGETEAAAQQYLCAAGFDRRVDPRLADHMELAVARLFMAVKRWSDAEPPLRRVVDNDPTNVRALVLHACVLMHLGDTEAADADLQVAERQREQREAEAAIDADAEHSDQSQTDNDYASVWLQVDEKKATDRGRWGDAAGLSSQILAIARARSDADPGGHESQLAADYDNHAGKLLMAGRRDEALEALLSAIRIRETLSALAPGEIEHRVQLALSLTVFGSLNLESGAEEVAADALGRAVAVFESIEDDDELFSELPHLLALALTSIGTLHLKAHRRKDAEEVLARAVPILEFSLDRNPDDDFIRITYANALSQLGIIQLHAGRASDAEDSLVLAASHFEHLLSQDPADPTRAAFLAVQAGNLAGALVMLGTGYLEADRWEDAEAAFTRVVDLDNRFTGPSRRGRSIGTLPPSVLAALDGLRVLVGMALTILAALHQKSGRTQEAEVALVRAVEVLGEDGGGIPEGMSRQNLLLTALESLAELYRQQGRIREADFALNRAEIIRQHLGDQTPENPDDE